MGSPHTWGPGGCSWLCRRQTLIRAMLKVSLQMLEGPVQAPGCEASVWGQSLGPHYGSRARLGGQFPCQPAEGWATSSAWEGGGFKECFWDKTTYKRFPGTPPTPTPSGCWEAKLQNSSISK